MRVKKRDGTFQQLQMEKIQRALLMAFQGGRERPDVMPLVHRVMERLVKVAEPYPIGTVSDTVESVLVDSGYADIAKSFMRHRIERDAARRRRLSPDSKAISSYIHVAKYARYRDELGRREVFSETVLRDMQMHVSKIQSRGFPGLVGLDDAGISELVADVRAAFGYVYRKEGMPSMRSMQFGGDAIITNNARLYNCSFGHISRWRAFQEMFWLLLSGCGVGYSVQWQHVECLGDVVRVGKTVCHYTIQDTIEGWADALGFLIECHTETGCYAEYDYSQIRSEGEPLKTSGGLAPGHLPLKRMIERVRRILTNAAGRKLRPIECHDIMCHAADAVLAGGIRRSSLISLFSIEDTEMMYCKASGQFRPAGEKDPGLQAQREMANNSAVLVRSEVSFEQFNRVIRIAQENYGCPGFYFTDNKDYGPNPCGEIGMWPMLESKCSECGGVGSVEAGTSFTVIEDCSVCGGGGVLGIESGLSFCNLTEVNVASCASEDDLYKRVEAMSIIGTLQAGYTDFSYLGPVTEEIVRRDALLGVGLTGIMDNQSIGLNKSALSKAAAVACSTNEKWSKLLGINAAARVTTIKPSGTSSLEMGGVGSGIHARWARRYIHRVTANPTEPQAQYFRAVNPHMVEVKPNGDWAICFPVECLDGAVTVKEQSAVEQLGNVFTLYENWIIPGTGSRSLDISPGLTHNVSCTITVRDGELNEVIGIIWAEKERIAAMSFAPYLLEKKFAYAPRQAIGKEDEELWNGLIRLYKPVDWGQFTESRDTTALKSEPACGGGVCEVV